MKGNHDLPIISSCERAAYVISGRVVNRLSGPHFFLHIDFAAIPFSTLYNSFFRYSDTTQYHRLRGEMSGPRTNLQDMLARLPGVAGGSSGGSVKGGGGSERAGPSSIKVSIAYFVQPRELRMCRIDDDSPRSLWQDLLLFLDLHVLQFQHVQEVVSHLLAGLYRKGLA